MEKTDIEFIKMARVDQIIRHPLFLAAMERVAVLEKDRIYCRHGIEHALAVCRMAYIRSLEGQLAFEKELIYAAGLLHDIGRYKQYEDGSPHHIVSTQLAEKILIETGFSNEERALILKAILHHGVEDEDALGFNALLYQADKKSRNCFLCPAKADCHWPETRMNQTIVY